MVMHSCALDERSLSIGRVMCKSFMAVKSEYSQLGLRSYFLACFYGSKDAFVFSKIKIFVFLKKKCFYLLKIQNFRTFGFN